MSFELIARLSGTIPSSLTAKTPTALIDYETFYTKDFSVSKMSYWHYCHDPRFRAYLVSIVTNDGLRWVGDPKDAPWEAVRGHVWVSHNKPFDINVHAALVEAGIVPDFAPPYWGDSMNLCAWIRVPRALAKAVKVLYGKVRSKEIRDKKMVGKQWEEYPAELRTQVCSYALEDGDDGLRIWVDHVESWPWKEVRISDLIMLRGLRGMYVDQAGLQGDIDALERVRFEALKLIPWVQADPDAKVASKPNLDTHCRTIGIEPPPSLSKEDPALQAWEDQHSEQYPFVRAMRDYNRAGAMLQKYKTIQSRIKPDGRFEFSVAYLGTHTGRTAGTDKSEKRKSANMLNMPRDSMLIRDDWSLVYRKKEMKDAAGYFKKHKKWPEGIRHSVYLRSKIIPAPGMKFVISDKSQIEARITAWLSRDKAMIEKIRQGFSVYEVHAIQYMNFVPREGGSLKEDDPFTYSLAKARELSLGFQAGTETFLEMAKNYVSEEEYEAIFNRPHTDEQRARFVEYLNFTKQKLLLGKFERGDQRKKNMLLQSWLQVQDFRKKRPGLTGLWKQLDNEIKRSASVGGTHVIELPSWRKLYYFDLSLKERTVSAVTERGSDERHFYHGGKLVGNCLEKSTEVFAETRGWIPITSVNNTDRLWDGEQFVNHDGLIERGVRPVVDCCGLLCTADHRFMTESGNWAPASIFSNHDSSHLETTRHIKSTLRAPDCFTMPGHEREPGTVVRPLRLRCHHDADNVMVYTSSLLRDEMPVVRERHLAAEPNTRTQRVTNLQGVELDEKSLSEQVTPSVRRLRRPGDNVMRGVEELVRGVPAGHGANVFQRIGLRSDRQQSRVLVRELPLDDKKRELPQSSQFTSPWMGDGCGCVQWDTPEYVLFSAEKGMVAEGRDDKTDRHTVFSEVFDILNCGPNRRFAVRAPGADYYLIAHNCVSATARDVFVEDQLRLDAENIWVVLDVYDEVVTEVPKDFDGKRVKELMSISPDWAKTLPVGASYEETFYYKK